MSELWENILFPLEERLEIAAGAIKFRDAQLSASQAREAELREKLEAAEARIKASQEQEPEAWPEAEKARTQLWLACEVAARSVLRVASDMGAKTSYGWETEVRGFSATIWEKIQPVYSIPPELAELQRENAELKRKLEAGWVKVCDSGLARAHAEIAELRKLLESKVPELTPDLIEIFGRPNFTCIRIADALRKGGQAINNRSEDEQAATILFLYKHYLNNKTGWRDAANEELKAMLYAASQPPKEPKQ